MADLEKSVAIIFEGVDQMGAGVDSATRQIDGVAGSVQKATEPMADLTKNVLAFQTALLATGVAVTGFAIKLAGDFDSQFREISTLIDEPTDSLAGFRQEILEYGRESAQSLGDINSAVYSAISAGVDYADSLDVVRKAEMLAIGGKSDLKSALIALEGPLNAYGAGAEEAGDYADALFQAVRDGITTLPELSASMSQATSLAANAGIEFGELLAAVSAITATGTPTSQAVTQVVSAISNMINPAKQARDLAAELNIEFGATALESEGLAGMMDIVAEATGGNTEQMATLFGSVQALQGVLTLTGEASDKFAVALENQENRTGAAQEAYTRMAGTVEQGTQRIQNAMTGALIAVGDPLLDEFTGIQAAIAEIFNAVGASITDGQLEGFVNQLESMMGGIEQTLSDVARNLPEALESADFSSFFNGIDMVREAISELFGGANLSSAEGLASVIETIGLAFETLSGYTAGAITALGPFLEQMANLVQFALELDPAWAVVVGTIGGASLALNTLASAVITFNGIVRPVLGSSGVIAKAAPLVSGLVGVLTGPVGLAAGVAITGAAVYTAGRDIMGFGANVDEATRELREQNRAIADGRLVWDFAVSDWVAAGEAQEDLATRMARMNREASDVILGIDRQAEAREREREARAMQEVEARYTDFDAVVEEAFKNSAAFADEQERTANGLRGVLEEIGPMENAWRQVNDGVFQQVTNIGELESAYAEVRAAFDKGLISQTQFDELTSYYESMRNGADTGAKAQQDLANEVLEGQEAILKARQAVLDYELSLEELASNERIKNFEISAGLQTAQLEADTARVEAAFNSISATIDNTGDVLQGLYGVLGSGDISRLQELGLEREIQRESARRDEAMRLEAELTREQIEQMRVRTDAIRNGGGLINISSDGLEPALEMVMWQIIEKVQLRASAEGAEFLLGLNGGGA
ncbi:phage tail tape measure protein [Halomonas sp. 1513]|nr:phage tail tape measure protein [Halomonas sp. 1513]APX94298.1 phage tail tape measure protein [Halomonas sp. 1513]